MILSITISEFVFIALSNEFFQITTHMIKGAEHMAIMKRPEMIEIVRKAIYDEIWSMFML